MFSGSKPYTAVTVQIDRLTSEQYEPDDYGGIVDLIEVMRLQGSGPTEAARALRKKLKYGNVHRQLRALTIIDCLLQNSNAHFQRSFADEPLLERLRVAATDPLSDAAVREKCAQLFRGWSHAYAQTPGLERIAALNKQLPKRKKPQQQQQSKVLRETEQDVFADGEDAEPASPPPRTRPAASSTVSSSSRPITLSPGPNLVASSKPKKVTKDKSNKSKFNLEKEKPMMLQNLASSSVAATNLLNALKLVNRESQRVSEDPEILRRFEVCKALRRQILRYIQHVESEQWLGSLIHANEELVNALMSFEILDKSVDDDSDSNDSDDAAVERMRSLSVSSPKRPPEPNRSAKPNIVLPKPANQMNLGKQRAVPQPQESDSESEHGADEDENDPFADHNAVATAVEPKSRRW